LRFHFEWFAGGIDIGVVDDVGEENFVTTAYDEIGDQVRRALIIGLCKAYCK